MIAGVAWAPHRGISKVEVQVQGQDWMEATLDTSAGSDSWCQWWLKWNATPGQHAIRCRATDGTGVTQTEDEADPAPNGASRLAHDHGRLQPVACAAVSDDRPGAPDG